MNRPQTHAPILLWPAGAPGARGQSSNDQPTLTPYLPDDETRTGAAIVICPGGGYNHLAAHEGHDYALWLHQHGVTRSAGVQWQPDRPCRSNLPSVWAVLC